MRVRSLQLHTVSGDVDLVGVLEAAREHRLRTISGDIDLSLAEPDLLVDFRTASGDLECDIPARVNRQSRKEYTVALGDARGHVVAKTVSGDLTIRDVTRPVTFDVELEGVGVDGKGGRHLGASATITIDRKDFGLVWNQPVQNGVLVGDKVKVDVGLEALDAATAKAMGLAA